MGWFSDIRERISDTVSGVRERASATWERATSWVTGGVGREYQDGPQMGERAEPTRATIKGFEDMPDDTVSRLLDDMAYNANDLAMALQEFTPGEVKELLLMGYSPEEIESLTMMIDKRPESARLRYRFPDRVSALAWAASIPGVSSYVYVVEMDGAFELWEGEAHEQTSR